MLVAISKTVSNTGKNYLKKKRERERENEFRAMVFLWVIGSLYLPRLKGVAILFNEDVVGVTVFHINTCTHSGKLKLKVNK